MLDLFRAEWKKTAGNRCLVGCTIWIWPIITTIFMGIFFIVLVFSDNVRESIQETPIHWDELASTMLVLLNSDLVRLVIMGFVTAVFTTEYHHNTWKTVLPGNKRILLILTKFVAIATFIVTTFVLTTLLTVVGFGIIQVLFGADYPPALSGDTLGNFFEEFFLNLALTFLTMMILIGVAAVVSILTRSLLFGVVSAVGLALLESIGVPIAIAIGIELLELDWMVNFMGLTFSYNVSNIQSWVILDQTAEIGYRQGAVTFSLEAWQSLTILIFYMLLSVSLAVFAFQRQDIQ